MDPWIVTPIERARHLDQFNGLGPIGGFVTGEQAKGFLLQSQLPPPILGQIWGMADVNCDGKMDINEFSVACKLITMKLKGLDLPPVLPPSLKGVLAGTGTTTPVLSPIMQIRPIVPTQPVLPGPSPLPGYGSMSPTGMTSPMAMAMPPTSLPLASQAYQQAGPTHEMINQRSMSIPSQDGIVSPLMEWAVPNPSRLKYTQQFNQNDRTKTGFLSGVQARNILMGTGLPQQMLATVWTLSDLDADGRLSCEEFILCMHLCDVARQMGRLPPKLPADLIPPSFRPGGSRKQSIKSSLPGSVTVSGHNTGSNTPAMEPEPLLSPGGTSFEDKRKMNYDKGQAELDRRRKFLEDMATREREERERKEREEFEKREKQRLEQEKRRQDEIEFQLATQREMEERRMDELRKSEEQKEAARKEMERQRQQEMEDTKRQELLARRQKEQDGVLRLKGVNHALGLELSQLADRVKELSGKITDTRVGVSTVKSEIDGMRSKRDTFMSDMAQLKAQLKDQNNRMIHAAQEKIRVEKMAAESEVKHINLNQLREKLSTFKEDLTKKQSDTDVVAIELEELKGALSTLIESCKSIYEDYHEKRDKVITMRKKHHEEFDYNAAWGAPIKRAGSLHVTEPEEEPEESLVYYRALYEFESVNPDELSFPAGAVIQRNDGTVADPGWLAGILDGKAGWFPESFVEIISADENNAEPITYAAAAPVTQASVESSHYEATGGEYYVAVYPYESAEPGDLPFEAGETVYVTHCEGEWWTGSVGSDRAGIFPANYVVKQSEAGATEEDHSQVPNNEEPSEAPTTYASSALTAFELSLMAEEGTKTELEPFEEAEIKREMNDIANKGPPKSPKPVKSKRYEIATVLANYPGSGEGQLTLTRGQLITVRKKAVSGWWEGELQAKGKRREIGWFPGSYVKILGPGGGSRQSSSRTTPIPFDEYDMPITAAPVYSDAKEQMIALYPYTAQNSDELSFVKDDVITIMSKDEPDWWRGQLGLSVGLFPVNYVQPLSQSENQEN